MAELYQVTLLGGAEHISLTDIKANISGLFKIPEEKAERLLARAPVVVNANLPLEQARKLASGLERCGARVAIAEMAPRPRQVKAVPVGSPARTRTCPACDLSQVAAAKCACCGCPFPPGGDEERRQAVPRDEPRDMQQKERVLPEVALQPMSIMEMLRRSVSLLREHFWPLAGISVLVPWVLMLAGCMALLGLLAAIAVPLLPHAPNVGGAGRFAALPASWGPGAVLLFAAVGLLLVCFATYVMLWAQAALTHAISECHLGHQFGVVSSYKFALKRLGALSSAMTVAGLLVGGLFILLAIPAAFLGPLVLIPAGLATGVFGLRYLLLEKVIVVENLKGGAARGRSTELIKGQLPRAVGILLAYGAMGGVVQLMPGVLSAVMPRPLGVVFEIVAFLVIAVGGALPAIGLCLFYYDCRLRKDGSLDYTDLARNL
ncbi:MAG: hypothetical protein V2A77_02205 [Pseudomonadota bacterium]